jgi:hypothetical protein
VRLVICIRARVSMAAETFFIVLGCWLLAVGCWLLAIGCVDFRCGPPDYVRMDRYCNQPEQRVDLGSKVRWYIGAVGVQGSEHGAHTPHYHGNTWLNRFSGEREDELMVIPGTTRTLDMVPDAAGVWMAHCEPACNPNRHFCLPRTE